MKTNDGIIVELDVVLPAEGQKPVVYADFLLKLQSKTRFFDRNLGYISWLQGKVLNMARKKCKRGEWGPFVGSIDVGGRAMTLETAQKLRKIADHVVESQAKIKSYSDMLKMIYPSYAKELRDDAKSDEAALPLGRKKRKLGGKRDSKKPLHPEKFQKALGGLLRDSQRLAVGMAEVGLSPTDEVNLCRDCIRMAKSTINELGRVETICKAVIAKYATAPRMEAA